MQTITLSNPNTTSQTIHVTAHQYRITEQVKLVLDPNAYAFDGDLFDEDAEMIAKLIADNQIDELQTLLQDTEITAEAGDDLAAGLTQMPTTRLIALLNRVAETVGPHEADWQGLPKDRLEAYMTGTRELYDRFQRMAWYPETLP